MKGMGEGEKFIKKQGSRAKSVELKKFDPPLWHAPYGRIV